jgi:Family of unknown function (DUF6112)
MHVARVVAQVSAKPEQAGLPGGEVVQRIVNGLQFWGLMACLVGIFIGAMFWAIASHSQNYQYTSGGKKATILCALGALVIGAGAGIINFFFHAGTGVR